MADFIASFSPIKQQVIKDAMNGCDVYLFPTYEETEGIPIIEACACKTTAIIRDIPIFEEIKILRQKNQNLTEVNLPDGLVTLGTGAFYNCTNLNSLFVPSSVVNFGLDICRLCSSNLMIYTTEDNYEFLVTQANRFNNNDFASHIKVQ